MSPQEESFALDLRLHKWLSSLKSINKSSQLDDLGQIIEEYLKIRSSGLKFFLYSKPSDGSIRVIFFKDRKLIKSAKISLPMEKIDLPAITNIKKIDVEEFIWSLLCRSSQKFKVSWKQRNSSGYVYFSEYIPWISDFAVPIHSEKNIPARINKLITDFYDSAKRHETVIFSEMADFICRHQEIAYLIDRGTRDAKLEWPLIDNESKAIHIKYFHEGQTKTITLTVEKLCQEIIKRLTYRVFYGRLLYAS